MNKIQQKSFEKNQQDVDGGGRGCYSLPLQTRTARLCHSYSHKPLKEGLGRALSKTSSGQKGSPQTPLPKE